MREKKLAYKIKTQGEAVKHTKYFGKRVKGIRRLGREKGVKMFRGVVIGSYYTLNQGYRNQAWRVRTDDGKLLSFTQVKLLK